MLLVALGLAAALVAYNTVTNLERSRESTYLVRNVVTGAGLVLAARAVGLSLDQLGLGQDAVAEGLRWGRLIVLVAAVGAAAAAPLADHVPAIARALDDRRADLPADRLAFQVFVRIPVGTAAFEELAFRGVLLAAFAQAAGTTWAVAASSVAFGLWHIGPARLTARINGVRDPRAIRRDVLVAVVTTTVGGLGFALLRLVSGSLLAPVLAHAGINGFGLLVAAARQRIR